VCRADFADRNARGLKPRARVRRLFSSHGYEYRRATSRDRRVRAAVDFTRISSPTAVHNEYSADVRNVFIGPFFVPCLFFFTANITTKSENDRSCRHFAIVRRGVRSDRDLDTNSTLAKPVVRSGFSITKRIAPFVGVACIVSNERARDGPFSLNDRSNRKFLTIVFATMRKPRGHRFFSVDTTTVRTCTGTVARLLQSRDAVSFGTRTPPPGR